MNNTWSTTSVKIQSKDNTVYINENIEQIIIWVIILVIGAIIFSIWDKIKSSMKKIKFIKNIFQKWWDKENYILFIDDNINDFPLVDSLRHHWYKIDILKDVDDIQCSEISRAKIIFIDHRWVWSKFWESEWLGLIKTLKKMYKNKKKLILFSATKFWIERIKEMSCADEIIQKNARTEDFINLIEKI